MKELSLVIPFYNEEKNVARVLGGIIKILNKKRVGYEIIAVNNGSRDDTGRILMPFIRKYSRVKVVNLKVNEGYGNGIIRGLKLAKGAIIGFMDGDGQISEKDLYRCYITLKKNKNIDLCKVFVIRREDPFIRRFLSETYNSLMRTLFKLKSKDINRCPKLMRRECYTQINPVSRDWFIDAEIIIKAERLGYSIKEIPVTFIRRKEGQSNVHFATLIEFISNIFRWRLKKL